MRSDWTIEVKPKATKTALAKSEVRDWLALYRRAWESKDVDLLIQLGEVTQDRSRNCGGHWPDTTISWSKSKT